MQPRVHDFSGRQLAPRLVCVLRVINAIQIQRMQIVEGSNELVAPTGISGLVLARYSMTDSPSLFSSHPFYSFQLYPPPPFLASVGQTVRPEKRDICWKHSRHLVSRTSDFMRLWKFKSRFPKPLGFHSYSVSTRCIEKFSYIVAVIYGRTIIVKLGPGFVPRSLPQLATILAEENDRCERGEVRTKLARVKSTTIYESFDYSNYKTRPSF